MLKVSELLVLLGLVKLGSNEDKKLNRVVVLNLFPHIHVEVQ